MLDCGWPFVCWALTQISRQGCFPNVVFVSGKRPANVGKEQSPNRAAVAASEIEMIMKARFCMLGQTLALSAWLVGGKYVVCAAIT